MEQIKISYFSYYVMNWVCWAELSFYFLADRVRQAVWLKFASKLISVGTVHPSFLTRIHFISTKLLLIYGKNRRVGRGARF